MTEVADKPELDEEVVRRDPLLLRTGQSLAESLGKLGDQLMFYGQIVADIPITIRRYSKETRRLLGEVTFGSGALAVVGGSIGIIIFLTFSTGAVVGLAGYQGLHEVGTEPYTGFISAYFNTREVAPLVSALALSATIGCGFTAQLGAMRIGEEIDALETMAIPPVRYLVTTRVLAATVAVIPLYGIGLLSSYAATRFVAVSYYGQSAGTYDHYFRAFLPVHDIYLSFLKVIIFAVIVVLIHCYYGFHASGGPAGVGVAVGRAVRLVIIVVNIADFFLSLVLFGPNTPIRIGG
jgi:phospholipid/cholesterol/gamma-HCH transport system permease protein